MPRHTNPPTRTLRPQELRPMTGPVNIPIGARPPPSRSPLMELADAFSTWQPELRASLRDAAAREDKDSWALGEQEAEITRAQNRMDDINTIAKRLVDEGKLPKARLPAFKEGYERRLGSDIAMSGVQTELLSALPGILASSGTPEDMQKAAEEAITAARQKHEALLPKGAFHARVAFDERATALANQFRQNSAAQWAAKVKSEGEAYQAYEAIDALHSLASAPADQVDDIRSGFLNTYSRIRAEMPVTETNEFFAKNVIDPAIKSLIEEEHYDEAEHLIDRVRDMKLPHGASLADVTPIRLTLGKYDSLIPQRRAGKTSSDLESLRNKRQLTEEEAVQEANNIANKLMEEGQWPPSAFKLNEAIAASYRAGDASFNPKLDSHLRTMVLNAREQRYDRTTGESLRTQVDTYDPTELDHVAAMVAVGKADGSLDPSVIRELETRISANRSVAKAIVPETSAFIRSLIEKTTNQLGGREERLNLDAVPEELEDYSKAVVENASLSELFQSRMGERYRLALTDAIRHIKNTDDVQMQMPELSRKIAGEVRKQGVEVLRSMQKDSAAQGEHKAATQIKQEDARWKLIRVFAAKNATSDMLFHKSRPWDKHSFPDKREYTVLTSELDASNKPESSKLKFSTTPPEGWESRVEAERSLPLSERTIVLIPRRWIAPFYARFHDDDTTVAADLDMLAKEVLTVGKATDAGPGNPERAGIAYGYYAAAKALAGFTPEEVLAGVTAQKIPVDPSEINPRAIPVFRSVAELDAAWNGKLVPADGILRKVHGTLKTDLSLEDFYRVQRRLLKSRK